MALTYCPQCRTVEGKTKEIELDGEEITVCDECSSEEELEYLPEHDDYDMDR